MNISLSETKRELVVLGHRLSLVEAALTQKESFSQALKAHRATCSVIEAIVEVGHMLDAGVDNLVWKEK
jgi:hypothetical protein